MYANASACCRKLKSLSFIKGLANQPWCNHRIHLLVSVHWAINLLSVSVHRGNAELYCRSGMVISCKQDKRYDADSALPTIMLWRGCHDSGRSVNTITVWGVSSLDITRVDDITPVMTAGACRLRHQAELLHPTPCRRGCCYPCKQPTYTHLPCTHLVTLQLSKAQRTAQNAQPMRAPPA